jgi:hypothetical protein
MERGPASGIVLSGSPPVSQAEKARAASNAAMKKNAGIE